MLSHQGAKQASTDFSTSSGYIPIPLREELKRFADVSVYRREEPPIGINFTSKKSKQLLRDCLEEETANTFFELVDQYQTQSDPSYCGPTNLTAVLNTLHVDPGEKWKGIWRWYDEEMIKCLNTEHVKDYGMTLNEFSLVLRCNGVLSKVYRPNVTDNALSSLSLQAIQVNSEDLSLKSLSSILNKNECPKESSPRVVDFSYVDYSFLQASSLASTRTSSFFLMFNLGRAKLQQTGDGHFTPLAAYHCKDNVGLLLESARFKYNSRWYDLRDIFNALTEKDKLADLPRGFLLIHKEPPIPLKLNEDRLSLSSLKEAFSLIDSSPKEEFLSLNHKAFLIDYFMRSQVTPLKELPEKIAEPINRFNEISNNFRSLVYFMYQFDNRSVISNLLHILSQPKDILFKGL